MQPLCTAAQLARNDDAGFTLVEVIVAVALFGLIALAGFTLLDSELNVQARTDGRLERLGDLQRAMYVLSADLEQMSSQPVIAGSTITFRRFAPDRSGGEIDVRFSLVGGDLQRVLGDQPQRLITGVSAAQWSFFAEPGGWLTDWPTDAQAPRPSAAAVDLTLIAGPYGAGGSLRRVVAIPEPP